MTIPCYTKNRRALQFGGFIRLFLALGLIIVVLASSSHAQFHVQLSPQLVEADVAPGSRHVLKFELTNQDPNEGVEIIISSASITQSVSGQYEIADSTQLYSCESWLVLPDSLIVIPPNSTRMLPVEMRVPTKATGGGYGAVVFEVVPPNLSGTQGQSVAARTRYRFQIPAWLEFNVKRSTGARKRMKAGSITVTRTADDERLQTKYGSLGLVVDAMVSNTGNILAFTTGRLIIRDENNQLIKDTRLGSGRGAVLPGAETRLRTITKLPPPGTYTVKGIIDYGGRSPAVTQATIELSRKAAVAGSSEISIPLEVEIHPGNVDLSAPIHAYRPFGATVVNREAFPVTVSVRPGQIYHDLAGGLWTTPNADSGRSIADWIDFDPKEFTINPNRRQNIRVTLNVPEGAAGGYYGCLLLTATPEEGSGQSDAFLPSEMKLPIVVTVPPDFEKTVEIEEVRFDGLSGGSAVKVAVKLANTGNMHVTARGSATIEMWSEGRTQVDGVTQVGDARFQEVGRMKIEADSILIFPGESRILISETIDQLPPGKYRAKLEVFYGTKQPATIEKEFLVEPRKN